MHASKRARTRPARLRSLRIQIDEPKRRVAEHVVIFSELTTHAVIAWRPEDRQRRMVNYRYKVQHRGYEHRYTSGLKAQLPPQLVELVSDEDYMSHKEIGKSDSVELT